MIEFRDKFARDIGAQLIVHTNRKAIDEGANPFRLGTQKCCGLLKTRALLDALAEGGFDAAFGGARRDEEKSRAKERIFSFRDRVRPVGSEESAPGAVESLQRPHRQGRKHPRFSAVQLDRAGRLAVHPRGKHSDRAAVLRQGAADGGARRGAASRSSTICRCCPASSRKWCNPGCARSAAPTAPAPFAPMPTPCPKIIEEMMLFRRSERENRVIDHDQEGSMELKKREGYF